MNKTETSQVVSAGRNQSISDFKSINSAYVCSSGIVSLTSSSTIHCIILLILMVIGLMLIHDPQFMKSVIITIPAIVTFSLMLPPNLNPVMGTATIVMIIGLMHKPSVTIRIVSCIARKTAFITVSVVIPILKGTVFIIVSYSCSSCH